MNAAAGPSVAVEATVHRFMRDVRALTGGVVVVAVSGGADSLCLLHALHRATGSLDISLHVAHLDHMLRGAESGADAAFVAAQAEALGLKATVETRNVAAYRDSRRCSLEEAAREVRYSFLRDVASLVGAGAVLTGHTQDDAVETIMLHILRGTGVHGLRGLETVSPYPLVVTGGAARNSLLLMRPLLGTSRSDAREYCRALRLQPREDASNESLAFMRNRIRLQLLPSMRELNPRVDEALLRLGRLAAEDDEQLSRLTGERWREIAAVLAGSVSFDLTGFLESAPAVQSRLVLQAMRHLNGCVRDVSAEHIAAVRALAAKPAGKQIDLPSGTMWRREEACLTAVRRAADGASEASSSRLEPLTLTVPGEVDVPGGRIVACRANRDSLEVDNPRVACVDATVAGRSLLVRGRLPGDRFRPLGMSEEKKLQDFMVDCRIPASARELVPIVCSPLHIVWVAGWRIDDRAKVTPETCEVVRLEFVPAS